MISLVIAVTFFTCMINSSWFFSIILQTKRQKNKKNNNLASKSYLPLEEYITSELKDIISKKTKKERSKKVSSE